MGRKSARRVKAVPALVRPHDPARCRQGPRCEQCTALGYIRAQPAFMTSDQSCGILYNCLDLTIPKLLTLFQLVEDRMAMLKRNKPPEYGFSFSQNNVCHQCELPLCHRTIYCCQCLLFIYCSISCRDQDQENHSYGRLCLTISVLHGYARQFTGLNVIQGQYPVESHFEATTAWAIMFATKVFMGFQNMYSLYQAYISIIPLLGLPNFKTHFIPIPGLLSLFLILQGKFHMSKAFLSTYIASYISGHPLIEPSMHIQKVFEASLTRQNAKGAFKEDVFEDGDIKKVFLKGGEMEEWIFSHILISLIMIEAVYLTHMRNNNCSLRDQRTRALLVRKYFARLPPQGKLYLSSIVMGAPTLREIRRLVRSEYQITTPLKVFDCSIHRGLVEVAIETFELNSVLMDVLGKSFSHITSLTRQFGDENDLCFECFVEGERKMGSDPWEFKLMNEILSFKVHYFDPQVYHMIMYKCVAEKANMDQLFRRMYGVEMNFEARNVNLPKILQFDRVVPHVSEGKLMVKFEANLEAIRSNPEVILLELATAMGHSKVALEAIEQMQSFMKTLELVFKSECCINLQQLKWYKHMQLLIKSTKEFFNSPQILNRPKPLQKHTLADHRDTLVYYLATLHGDGKQMYQIPLLKPPEFCESKEAHWITTEEDFVEHATAVIVDIAQRKCNANNWPHGKLLRYFTWRIGTSLFDCQTIDIHKFAFYFAIKSFERRHPETRQELINFIFKCEKKHLKRAFKGEICGFSKKSPFPSLTILSRTDKSLFHTMYIVWHLNYTSIKNEAQSLETYEGPQEEFDIHQWETERIP